METIPAEGAAKPAYRTRTWALFAASAPVAVILRRGPRRHFRLIRWDLAHDTFELGQWLHGDVRLCDLSADGSKLLCVVAQRHRAFAEQRAQRRAGVVYEPLRSSAVPTVLTRHRNRRVPRYLKAVVANAKLRARRLDDTWTALSVPPWFTALAIWPTFGSWTGGGVFAGGSQIVLFETPEGLTPITNVPMPSRWRIRPPRAAERPPLAATSPCCDATLEPTARVWAGLLAGGARSIDWVLPRADGDLLFAADGGIYRLGDWQHRSDDLLRQARRLIDLAPMSFERIAPGADALRW